MRKWPLRHQGVVRLPTDDLCAMAAARAVAIWLAALSGIAAHGQIKTSVPATQPAVIQPAEERFMSDEEFLKIGEEFDLDAYVRSLNPPTVDDIIKSLQPIPTLEQILDDLNHPERLPKLPTLPDEIAKQIHELDARKYELESRIEHSNNVSEQDGALDEAIELADQIMKLRLANGQPADWWEVIDAQSQLIRFVQLRDMSIADRQRWRAIKQRHPVAIAAYRLEEFEQSISIVRAQLAITQQLAHGNPLETATLLYNMATLLRIARSDYPRAERLFRAALTMRSKMLGAEHPKIANCIDSLGIVLYDQSDYVGAEPFYRQSLVMYRRLQGATQADVAISINRLATLLQDNCDYSQAELLYGEALSMFRRLSNGEQDRSVADTLDHLASLRHSRGDYVGAEPLFLEALDMRRNLRGDESLAVASSLNNLAMLLRDKGDYARAEPLLRDALAMNRRLLGAPHRVVASSLNNLALSLKDRGDYSGAKSLYREALDMRRQLLGDESLEVAITLNNLAMLQSDNGDYAQAEPLFREALGLLRKWLGAEHPRVAMGLDNLSLVLRAEGDFVGAAQLSSEALAIYRSRLGENHPDVAISLNNLALALGAQGDYARAEQLMRQAIANSRQGLGEGHPRVAIGLHNLAKLLKKKGDYPTAEPLYQETLGLVEKLRVTTVGSEQERAMFAQTLDLNQLSREHAAVLIELHHGSEALGILERGRARAALDLLESSGRNLVAEARASGDVERSRRLDAALAAEQSAKVALNDVEARLASLSRERTGLEGRSDVAADKKAARLTELDQDIAKFNDEVKQKRFELSQAGAAVLVELRGLFPAGKPLTLEEILAGLSADEAVVSFAWGEDSVLVAVACNGTSTAELIAKDKEAIAPLTERVRRLRASIARKPGAGPEFDLSADRELLATLLPDSIRRKLSYARRLIVLPDGPLNDVPLEALLLAEAKDSLLAGKAVVYAPSATVYLDRKRRSRESKDRMSGKQATAVVLGDPVFPRPKSEPSYPKHGALLASAVEGGNAANAGLRRGDILLRYDGQTLDEETPLSDAIGSVAAEVENGKRPDDTKVKVAYWREGQEAEVDLPVGKLGVQIEPGDPGEALRSQRVMDQITRGGGEEFSANVSATEQVRLFGGPLDPLPGSGREARAIASLFKASKGLATLLTGPAASVPKLWEAVTKSPPRYLHLATHGLTGSADRPLEASLALSQPENPTLEDVGFLRLEDLLGSWGGRLDGCELVVLSACDTHRGIRKGDTAMSLPLGFFYAGAPTVIASLWQVDDKATSLLMTRMYENLLGAYDEPRTIRGRTYQAKQSMTKLDALDEAKAWLRSLTEPQRQEALARLDETAAPALAGASDKARGLGDPQPAKSLSPESTHPYDHPYYWAGFILVGDAD